MNARTVRAQSVLVLATLLLLWLTLPSRALGCVVGTGTSASCTESALDACLPGGGNFDSTVTFNCGGAPKTISLTTLKTISADTTIDGGSTITLSSSNYVFNVTASHFTVQNLTLTTSGGVDSIFNLGSGTVTATNCTFSSSNGFGIANVSSGMVTATHCTFSGNAVGISNNLGGGTGTVTATNCTFSGNSGAGISNDGSGTVTATSCTFSGNNAGIRRNFGSVTVTNTILANNTANCVGSITDGGHNIDDGTTCFVFKGANCSTTTGTSFCKTNPDLAAGLANNGGSPQTIALLAGSPAINAGDEAVCAAPPVNNLDERGFIRPGVGATNCSIGAFEFDAIPSKAVHQAPALSASWLFTLATLLAASGWLTVRRSQSRR